MKKTLHSKKRSARAGQGGFTLIELLVVIAIIGLVSSIAMYSLTAAREKALDTKRVQDIRQLQIAAELRLLENVQIPTAAVAKIDAEHYAAAPESDGFSVPGVKRVVNFLTMTPTTAEADAAQYADSVTYYKNLFGSGLFFKVGTPMPQDPQCDETNPVTCYRAYYDNSRNVLVIATTLRTKKHVAAGGFQAQAQYGIVVGTPSNLNFGATCAAIGFPVFSTAQSATNILSCDSSDPNGVSSIIQGITNGRNIVGATGIVGSI